MYNNNRILAIIAARANSKGLPNKNILPLLDKPVIAWTLQQAKQCDYIDKVILTTDDELIAGIGRNYGADVPFIRPKELAEDSSKIIDVIFHTIEFLREKNETFDIVVLLQPTCPLRKVDDILQSIELLFDKNAQAVVSVVETGHSPLWANTLPLDGCMNKFLNKDVINRNRQELPTYFRLNGSIYVSYIEYLKKNQSFHGEKTFAYIMPRERSVDIDDNIDYLHIKAILENSQRTS